MKISFKNDYSEGAHPAILEALLQTNRQQQPGYGLDDYSEQAKALIRERIGNPQAEIFFVSGGTQANLLVLGHILRPHESIIACQSAHIADHETGAIEAVGHKIHLAPSDNGKLSPEQIRDYASRYTNVPHQVQPRLVYITQTTEIGTLYSLAELKAIWQCCQELGLLLYMANTQMNRIKEAFVAKGIGFLSDTCTNQLFPILTQRQIAQLSADFDFYLWQKVDAEHTAIRLITSWATEDSQVEALLRVIEGLTP